MSDFNPIKIQMEIYLARVQPGRMDAAVEACKSTWNDLDSVAWTFAPPEADDPDGEAILTGYGWLVERTQEQLADQLRAAVVAANGRPCAMTTVSSEMLSAGEMAMTYGPRGARTKQELRNGKYVRVK